MDQYEKGKELGRGTFGAVYAARRKSDGLEVAIKRVHTAIGSDGVDFTALREILALTQCDCDNVLRLIDVFASKDKILLVMEQMALDLHKVITNKLFPLSLGYVKGYAVQMWRGLEHLHARWIAHRDIKPSNMLLSRGGVLKLADLGMSRCWGVEGEVLSPHVVTRQYRAPELLFGAPLYDANAVDVWAGACVMAELFSRSILFNGSSDIDQLSRIFAVVGTPSEESWPGARLLPDYLHFDDNNNERQPLDGILPAAPPVALALLSRCLSLRAAARPTAAQIVASNWWQEEPLPVPPEKLIPQALI